MSQVNYNAMSDRDLKRYFLEHRDDKAALEAYLDRRRKRSSTVITKVGDPDFDIKLQAAIRQQMQGEDSSRVQQ
ncbi:MAG: hypothetical protein KME17_21220 [Cyanosarcina radialis HA8281-LM2]|jgi:hypothetical protein|nr:hypothetical protein [Cyanosarcina radialis HA8281-LM2]